MTGTNDRTAAARSRAQPVKDTARYQDSLTVDGRYRLLVEAVTDYAIYMLDPTGIVSSWNPGAARFKGYTADEIIGQHFSRFYTAEDRAAGLPARALATAEAKGRVEAEGWRVRKDGTHFWANVVIDPIRDQRGEIVGFAKITRDLTERRATEEQLRQSEEQFRILIQAVTDYAIYMLDPKGMVASWNAGAERIKGYTAAEIVGKHFSLFYTADSRAKGDPEQALAEAARDGRFERVGRRVRKDGTEFWANVVIDPIRNAKGEVIGFAKVTRDITERINAEQELERARELLFQSQKMEAIGQLTGGVAHDFNNLLTVILGGLDTIRRAKPGEDARIKRAADLAFQGAQRAAGLTSRLLAFSRRQPLDPKPLDLNLLVRDMTELLHRTLGEHIELEGILAPRLWQIEADRHQLEAAILNLAVNARDAMQSGGKLTLETANTALDETYTARDSEVIPGQYVTLSVADTGTGIPAEIRQRVFEPFFTTKEPGQGTGLGLSMVYGFVKQSGGHVTLYSEPGVGTNVKVYLPRSFGPAEKDQTAAEILPAPGSSGEIVLLVEDNDSVRAFSGNVLRELGYQVIEVAEAAPALVMLTGAQKIDLLFTDVVLPGMSGRVLADEARKLRPGLKVLFTTGYSRNAIVQQGRLEPGVQLISKPFTVDQLALKVREILDAPKV